MTARRSSYTCQAPGCDRVLPPARRRFCSDLCRRRGHRAERTTETPEFGRMVVRMIRSYAARVGVSDIDNICPLWEVRQAADDAVTEAINDLRRSGFSWERIGAEIGMSRQAVQQWHARRQGVNDPLTTPARIRGA